MKGLLNIIKGYQIPNVSDMKDDTFVLKDANENILYDGYDLSYIMVRYIIESLGKDYLFSLSYSSSKSASSIILLMMLLLYKFITASNA